MSHEVAVTVPNGKVQRNWTIILLLLKCGYVLWTLHRQRKANLHLLNSLFLDTLQLTCKISHASPTAGWNTKCFFFPFLEASVYYNISWIHNFPPSVLYPEWQPKQWDYLLPLTTPDLSRGLGQMTLRAPSSLSVLWCPWTCFRAPSCWMHEGHWLSLQWCNKIKLGHGIMCILIILYSVWARLEFRLIFLEPYWL